MEPGTTPDLHAALQLSAQMLEAAQVADWTQVADLHSNCAEHLRRPWPASSQTRDAFQTVQERHRSVVALVAQARDAVGRELGTVRGKHRALSAYLDASGGN